MVPFIVTKHNIQMQAASFAIYSYTWPENIITGIPNTRDVRFSRAKMVVLMTDRMRKSCGPG